MLEQRMKSLILTSILLIAANCLAYTGQEAFEFVKYYRPYQNSYESIETICAIYANRLFYNTDFKTWLYDKLTEDIFIVTAVFSVSKPKPEVLEDSSVFAKTEIADKENELRLEWRVDMNNEDVRPHNDLAKDSLNFYEKMLEKLGVTLKRNF